VRRTETRTIPARDEVVEVEVVCDLGCGRSARVWGGHPRWSNDQHVVEDVEVSFEQGTSYPEGTSLTKMLVDICPDCFNGKLKSWLESQGAVFATKDIEF
jgi:hypothetical protein